MSIIHWAVTTIAVSLCVALIQERRTLWRMWDEAWGEVARLNETLDLVDEALARHPRACDKHAEGDPVSCGWKRAVMDVQDALDGDA